MHQVALVAQIPEAPSAVAEEDFPWLGLGTRRAESEDGSGVVDARWSEHDRSVHNRTLFLFRNAQVRGRRALHSEVRQACYAQGKGERAQEACLVQENLAGGVERTPRAQCHNSEDCARGRAG
ncbi:hypothetical protein A2264_02550 [candidate division WWE3 bacterium RIFOXYA2_FULL_46_9]|uniref:Uncharacterized protein n=1 Tax=candidate division WWE3 bacterium RIFOXYA2_FULL_46_9 TaxID=1802636 RepID=A0A1F4VZ22_UNCKA|nr:MAG: hypothetical protein A2264_02550 [candidate division WWE3 bacterium RIFOXYA2_FULL_46_9]